MNFENNQEFILVSTNSRTTPVLAIIDEGSLCTSCKHSSKLKTFFTKISGQDHQSIEYFINYPVG
jgi:hypothetical protein